MNENLTKDQEKCLKINNDESIVAYTYKDVIFKTNKADMSEQNKQDYIEYYIEKMSPKQLKILTIYDDELSEDVQVHYETVQVPFSRIRRITGYLVGDMSHWNNGKKAEEKDRVKHGA